MISYEINRLLKFALDHELISQRDKIYCANLLLDVLQLSQYEEEEVSEVLNRADDILDAMLDYAITNKLIEDTITQRDLFDTRIMNCIMPRPSVISDKFWDYYKISPQKATDYYYNLSIASNYIRKSRVEKDMKWVAMSKYGELEISINLSKPEKDPKEIAKAKLVKATTYPKCAICKENEGFAGNLKLAARESHRLIPLQLSKEDWYLQYSPYVYYNEHCIILNSEHKDMIIDRKGFANLLEFLDYFPHYFIGSNADLPIVGGSILTHDHYQGGCYTMPIMKAKVIKRYELNKYPDVEIEHIYWPLTTLRITAKNKDTLIDCSDHILNKWRNYSDESLQIYATSSGERHNTITPIARKKDDLYELNLVLRNNKTSVDYPLGIFHPHQEVHHIKKENIGVIEVAGLAILPARLKDELQIIRKELNGDTFSKEEGLLIDKHKDWIKELKEKRSKDMSTDLMDFLKAEIAIRFQKVLEDCGVFKFNEEGVLGLERFIEIL
ncbi:MAG: UDP-glucose--hexose-1-phosphate uridylyltransferase [Erysipelotrichaceae bacterium]